MTDSRLYPIDEVLASLQAEEGFSATAYRDSLGWLTIGYGRLIDERRPGGGVSEEEGLYLLRNDITRTVTELRRAVPFFAGLDGPRCAVVIELGFQLGLGGLLGFRRMLAALERGDNEAAADELLDSRYAEQVPARAARYAERLRTVS